MCQFLLMTDPTMQTLIVAGGWKGYGFSLDTTELLRPGASAWKFGKALPHRIIYAAKGNFSDG